MDQGVAAVWAGIAGLAGAGIGGAAAVWGSAIAGRKSIEAAKQQSERAAAAEHQHWQRQARFDAYRSLLAIAEEMGRWARPLSVSMVVGVISRLREAVADVHILGPAEASAAAGRLLEPALEALFDFRAAHPEMAGSQVAGDESVPWGQNRTDELLTAHAAFRETVRAVLERPPV